MTSVREGAYHLRGFLTLEEQIRIAERVRELGEREAGFYQPVARGLAKMRLRMLCLGRHWNARTYRYESHRTDADSLPVQALPDDLADIARGAAESVGMRIEPDIAIVNAYAEDGRLGTHQDRDERPETLAAGIPVVSISLGDSAVFLFGGASRRDPVEKITLASGDAFVFGGPSRLCYHGISRIQPGTGPSELPIRGRVNITFRQY
jgi:DNA alkylation damage repair protein AlkB